MRPLGFLPVFAVLLAGCASPPEDLAAEVGALPAQADSQPPFLLQASGCTEGGGHSVHPEIPGYLPEPWKPADVMGDTGDQVMYSELPYNPDYPAPTKGHTMGNYHATVVCKSWSLNGQAKTLMFGWVGMRVQPPPFDDATAERHYLTTVIATNDEDFHHWLHQNGFHASKATGVVDWPQGLFHNVLDTADHGVYESAFAPKDVGPSPAGITRIWFQRENQDHAFSPIALDMKNAAGRHLIAEGQGYFSHLRTDDHWPVPGAVGHTAGLVWKDFDRTFTLGPRPNVKLAEAYVHL